MGELKKSAGNVNTPLAILFFLWAIKNGANILLFMLLKLRYCESVGSRVIPKRRAMLSQRKVLQMSAHMILPVINPASHLVLSFFLSGTLDCFERKGCAISWEQTEFHVVTFFCQLDKLLPTIMNLITIIVNNYCHLYFPPRSKTVSTFRKASSNYSKLVLQWFL